MAASSSNSWTVAEITVTNYRHRGYGGFLGVVDVMFPPGVVVIDFHIYVSAGRARVGAPQDKAHKDLCWFTSADAFEQFEMRIVSQLINEPAFLMGLRRFGLSPLQTSEPKPQSPP